MANESTVYFSSLQSESNLSCQTVPQNIACPSELQQQQFKSRSTHIKYYYYICEQTASVILFSKNIQLCNTFIRKGSDESDLSRILLKRYTHTHIYYIYIHTYYNIIYIYTPLSFIVKSVNGSLKQIFQYAWSAVPRQGCAEGPPQVAGTVAAVTLSTMIVTPMFLDPFLFLDQFFHGSKSYTSANRKSTSISLFKEKWQQNPLSPAS